MVCLLAAAVGAVASLSAGSSITLLDAFGRDITRQGFVLLDWDGYMANPAVKLAASLAASEQPRVLDIRSDCVRLIFDRSGDISTGPLGKSMRIEPGQSKAEFWISIFPDRDAKNEEHTLEMRLRGDKDWTAVKVKVIDQDKPMPPGFKIWTDFSQDKTGFLRDASVRKTIRQAANDWAYFLADMNLDTVPKGDEATTLWTPDGFVRTYTVKNGRPYRGFLLYFTGIRGPDLRSGGAPSYDGKRQSSQGIELPLLRSGAVEVEVQGSYTKYGWHIDTSDANWWVCGSQASEPADLYSIMLHEIGHALAFEGNYPRFGEALRKRKMESPDLVEYLGYPPAVDAYCHFDRCLDPASGFGAFGAEYQAKMKVRRWLLTKTHLLLLQAVGYRLAPLSCFEGLSIASTRIVLKLGKEADGLTVLKGGVPSYLCSISGGRLPKGLSIGESDGRLWGAPEEQGAFEVSLEACDQSPNPTRISSKIAIVVEG